MIQQLAHVPAQFCLGDYASPCFTDPIPTRHKG